MKALTLTVSQARELERQAIEEFGLPSFLLMENAGRELSAQIQEMLLRFPRFTPVAFFCGGGKNAGDGFVAARYLFKHHSNIKIYLFTPADQLSGDTLLNYKILLKYGLEVYPHDQFPKHVVDFFQRSPIIIVDAMVGTGFKPPLRETMGEAIRHMTHLKKFHNGKVTIIAADIPTGLDGDQGFVGEPVVPADLTITFASIKKGLTDAAAGAYIGRLKLVDIGIPEPLLEAFHSTL